VSQSLLQAQAPTAAVSTGLVQFEVRRRYGKDAVKAGLETRGMNQARMPNNYPTSSFPKGLACRADFLYTEERHEVRERWCWNLPSPPMITQIHVTQPHERRRDYRQSRRHPPSPHGRRNRFS
jgi:hypothetical protein